MRAKRAARNENVPAKRADFFNPNNMMKLLNQENDLITKLWIQVRNTKFQLMKYYYKNSTLIYLSSVCFSNYSYVVTSSAYVYYESFN